MTKKFDVTVITGKYKVRDGVEKNRYQTVGVVLETRNGLMLKLESIPIGWDGWAYLNEPRDWGTDAPRERRTATPVQARPASPADFDDPPF